MKTFSKIALFLMAFLLVSCSSFSQKKVDVIFYNVENLFDTINQEGIHDGEFTPEGDKKWTSDRYNTKINHINQVLDQFESIGIVGVCEIENRSVLEDIVTKRNDLSIAHVESNDSRGIDVGLLYNNQVFACDSIHVIRFELEVEGKSKPTRDILVVQLRRKKEVYHILVNHWPSRRGGQEASNKYRLQAAKLAKAYIDETLQNDPKANIILMGDLNDHPENDAPALISESLTPIITRESGKYGGSYNYRGDWNLLDHIYVSNNLVQKRKPKAIFESAEIGSWDFLITEYRNNLVPFRTYGGKKYLDGYSDHLPVFFQLQF